MAEVVCDTSFVMHAATARIRNEGRLDVEIGELLYVVPPPVVAELGRLRREGDPARAAAAAAALEFVERRATVGEPGGGSAAAAAAAAAAARAAATARAAGDSAADAAIVEYARAAAAPIVATMDRRLKRAVKRAGGSVLSVSGDRIVLEP